MEYSDFRKDGSMETIVSAELARIAKGMSIADKDEQMGEALRSSLEEAYDVVEGVSKDIDRLLSNANSPWLGASFMRGLDAGIHINNGFNAGRAKAVLNKKYYSYARAAKVAADDDYVYFDDAKDVEKALEKLGEGIDSFRGPVDGWKVNEDRSGSFILQFLGQVGNTRGKGIFSSKKYTLTPTSDIRYLKKIIQAAKKDVAKDLKKDAEYSQGFADYYSKRHPSGPPAWPAIMD